MKTLGIIGLVGMLALAPWQWTADEFEQVHRLTFPPPVTVLPL